MADARKGEIQGLGRDTLRAGAQKLRDPRRWHCPWSAYRTRPNIRSCSCDHRRNWGPSCRTTSTRVLHVTRAGFLRWQSDHGGEAVPILIRPITNRKLDFAGVGSGGGRPRRDRHRPTAKCSGHRNYQKNRPPTSPSSRILPSIFGSCPRRPLSMSPDSGNVKRTPRQVRS